MKKRILLFTAVAGLACVTLSSNDDGLAFSGSLNRTGAKGSTTTCGGSGCHGSAAGPVVTITLDSASHTVTKYTPGKTYTVKISAPLKTGLPRFGFQFASVSGSGSSQVQAGTFSSLPSNVRTSTAVTPLTLVEHNTPIAAGSTSYDVSFSWTAPTSGVGTISLYCTMNAVDFDTHENSADVSGNTLITLTQNATTTGVASLPADMSIKAFPNPVMNSMNLQLNNAQAGTYTISVFSLAGKVVAAETVNVTGTAASATINMANQAAGTYMVSVEKDGARSVIPVVKQ